MRVEDYTREEWNESFPGEEYPGDSDMIIPELLPPPELEDE